MIASDDRRTRVAGARVAGRVYAVPFDAQPGALTTTGLADGLFRLLNSTNDVELLAAMDALGLMRQNIATALEMDYASALTREAETQKIAGESADAREGGIAFLQKRKAEFKGH